MRSETKEGFPKFSGRPFSNRRISDLKFLAVVLWHRVSRPPDPSLVRCVAMSTPTESVAPLTPPAAPVPPQRRTVRNVILAGLALGLVAVLAISLAALVQADATPTVDERHLLPNVVNQCAAQEGYGGEVSDAGKTLTFDMEGKDPGSGQGTVNGLMCVLKLLGTPDYITEDMTKTRALDGRQTATWNVYTAAWRYHPDNGLDVIIHVR